MKKKKIQVKNLIKVNQVKNLINKINISLKLIIKMAIKKDKIVNQIYKKKLMNNHYISKMVN